MKFLSIACSISEDTHPGHIYKGLVLAITQKETSLLHAYKIHLHARDQMLATSNGEEVRE